MSYTHYHKNGWVELLCFWEDDNLMGCVIFFVLSPILIPLALIVWVCGGFRKYVGVCVYGDLSVPIEKFRADAKKCHVKVIEAWNNCDDVTHVICNQPNQFPNLKKELSRSHRTSCAKIVTEEDFIKETRFKYT